ncbi:DUF1232 domain-containing protein [Enhygromyxa salina]|nr:DUF1232 domain-containing protein [Enhygromyxa salina]
MRWELFGQITRKLAAVRDFEPERDAARYAEQLLALHPRLFTRLDGGPESVVARMAARTIAVDHLREVCQLPDVVAELQRSMANSTMGAGERLVRVAGLAYLVCENDLIRDDLPAGFGLVDDCIVLRGARLATAHVLGTDHFVEDLTMIHYLAVAIPDPLLPDIEAALALAAELEMRTRPLPNAIVELAIRELIERPPTDYPPPLLLPDHEAGVETQSPLLLSAGEIDVADAGLLVIEFEDGTRLQRNRDATLEYA